VSFSASDRAAVRSVAAWHPPTDILLHTPGSELLRPLHASPIWKECRDEIGSALGRYLIPPELVMTRSEQIGLTDKQRATIKSEIQKMQTKFIDAQADRIMALEREIKRAHLALLVRIKNTLTAEQIAKLEAIRRAK
jgi:hypothetical protein